MNQFIRFLLPTYQDELLQIKHRTFLYYCAFRVLFIFYTLSMAVLYPNLRGIYLGTTIAVLLLTVLAVLLARPYFSITVRVYFVITWLMTTGYLFWVRSDNAGFASLVIVYLTLAVVVGLAIAWYWGLLFFTGSALALVLDVYCQSRGWWNSVTMLRADTNPIQFLISIGSFFFVATGVVAANSAILQSIFVKYQNELALRREKESELKRLNESLADMNCKLEEHIAALQDANEKMSQYAYMNSHKVRGPITRLMGLASIMDLTLNVEEKETYAHLMVEETELLDKVVRSINDTFDNTMNGNGILL